MVGLRTARTGCCSVNSTLKNVVTNLTPALISRPRNSVGDQIQDGRRRENWIQLNRTNSAAD